MSSALSSSAELERELRAAAPSGSVSSEPDQLDLYTADGFWPAVHAQARGEPLGRPDVVVVPASEQEVGSIVELADRTRTPVVPWGGGSGTQGGAIPVAGGIVVDLRGLTDIVEIDEVSLTATVQAGLNGCVFERALNARGLMFPHYPASVDRATIGGYVAARGSGVLSTRYGKIEDLVLALRVVSPACGVIDTLPTPRHAAGPELTQLYIGSEGTLGVITRATVAIARLPACRRFEALRFPTVIAGIDALRDSLQRGNRPSVIRLHDAEATRSVLNPIVGAGIEGVCALLVFEGQPASVAAEIADTLKLARDRGGDRLDPALSEAWWEHRYDIYEFPHQSELPAIWGTIDVVARYRDIPAVVEALKANVGEPYAADGLELRMHFSHWYTWGTMVYARFEIPGAAAPADAVALHDEIWRAGVESVLAAGGVMSDHHGVGLKLAPYMRRQWGAAFDQLVQIKKAVDPNNIMNPGKLGF